MHDESGRRGQAAGPARASRRELWARLRHSLWQPPRPHGEQPRERAVGPLELFYDLAVVVLVAQAAHHLAGNLTGPPGPTAACTTSCTAAKTPAPAAHSCCRSWCSPRWPPSSPRRAARGEPRSPSPRGSYSRYWPVLWLLAARGDRPQYRRTSGLFVTGTAACAVLLAATALLPASARVLCRERKPEIPGLASVR